MNHLFATTSACFILKIMNHIQYLTSGRWHVLAAVALIAHISMWGDLHGESVPFSFPAGLEATSVASEPMLKNPVAISVGVDNTIYVTETRRRKAQNLDIRSNPDWIESELSLQSVGMKLAFYRSELTPENSGFNQHRFEDLNLDGVHDWKDLTVVSEIIHAIKDVDGDGRANQSTIFADGFQSPVTGVAAGILSWNGHVYANIAPHLWKLSDADRDGIAETRSIISTGFANHIAYAGHNTHGITIGPDGRLYWSVGDVSSNYTPHEGAIFRCLPDGTEFEVYATGLRNPQEFVFDDFGNIFTGDNDADYGDRERWYWIVEDGDYGWRFWWQYQVGGDRWKTPDSNYSVWMDEKLWHTRFPGQSAFIIPAIQYIDNGPCGMTAYPGIGLPAEYNNSFFLAHFTGSAANSGIRNYKVVASGAGYDLKEDRSFVTGSVVTGVDFAPDGSGLFFTDWSGSWPLNEQGKVFRLSHPDFSGTDLVRQSQRLLNGGLAQLEPRQLAILLSHPNRNVRREAQFKLVDHGQSGHLALLQVAQSDSNLLARIHALWGMDMMARETPRILNDLIPFLQDATDEIQAQTARILGDHRHRPAGKHLDHLLAQAQVSPRLQFMTMMALGKLAYRESLGSVLRILEINNNEDLMIRHAGICYLKGLQDFRLLADLKSHASPAVRIAGVVALRKMASPHVAHFLKDHDPLVVAEAARAINDVPLEPARKHLASILHPGISDESLIRRVLNAHYRLGFPENAQALAQYAAAENAVIPGRLEALKMLRQWTTLSPRDRVCGGWFPLRFDSPQRNQDDASTFLKDYFDTYIAAPEPVALEYIKVMEALNIDVDPNKIHLLASGENNPSEIRLAALNLLAKREMPGLLPAIRATLWSSSPNLRTRAMVLLDSHDPRMATELVESTLQNGSVAEKQLLLDAIAPLANSRIQQLLSTWFSKLENLDKSISDISLDLFLAAEKSPSEELQKRAQAFRTQLNTQGSFKLIQELATQGGNPRTGRDLFVNKVELACLRCHQIPDGSNGIMGGTMGPNLQSLSQRSDIEYRMYSILDPNRDFAPGFEMVTLTLNDNSQLSGRIVRRTPTTLTLEVPGSENSEDAELFAEESTAPAYQSVDIPVAAIQSQSIGISAMPPGLNHLMTLTEFRDLMAYLSEL